MLRYKGYVGSIRVDMDARVIRGSVVNTRDVITFQGATVDDVEREFHRSVDEYVDFCEENGLVPEKPFSGCFTVRIGPKLHREFTALAASRGVSLNALIASCLRRVVRRAASTSDSVAGGTG